jgi:shikimate 5-dehydrogenase
MSKLEYLQKVLTNDLRVFPEPFFEGLEGFPKTVDSTYTQKHEPYQVPSLDIFESWGICGIVGGRKPSTYSESPRIWNNYFRGIGRDVVFFAFDLPQEKDFAKFMKIVFSIPKLLDLTVTDPYKHIAFQSLKGLDFQVRLSEQAADAKVVNHLILDSKNETLLGLNTDGIGMIWAIKEKVEVKGRKVLIIGAGGSAVSIGYEFVRAGSDLFITNRTASRAKEVSEFLAGSKTADQHLAWADFDDLVELLKQADIVVNTVPEGCPLDADGGKLLKVDTLLAETTYGSKSAIKDLAMDIGLDYVDGRAMLFGQFIEAANKVYPLLGVSEETHEKGIRNAQSA